MYYDYPQEEAAYAARYQYFFGEQMIAAPIVQPADRETGLAITDIWVPPGDWIEITTKETFRGPRWIRQAGDIDRIPMLIRQGGILPLAAPFRIPTSAHLTSGTTEAIPDDCLILSVFPGPEGSFRLYEDDGLTEAYREGNCEWTEITTQMESHQRWVVKISPIEGQCDALPEERGYEVRLEGTRRPDRMLLDGNSTSDWDYDPDALRTTIEVSRRAKTQPVTVTALASGGISALGESLNQARIQEDVERLLRMSLPDADESDILDAVMTARGAGRDDALARLGGPLLRFIEFTTPEEAASRLGQLIVGAPARAGVPFDLEIDWVLSMGQGTRQHAVRLRSLTQSQILDAPFSFDGQVRSGYWSAEARITWRGMTLTRRHQSQPFFPTVNAWQVALCNREADAMLPPLTRLSDRKVGVALTWKDAVQTSSGLTNILQPYAIPFSRLAGDLSSHDRAGSPDLSVAYARTSVRCPSKRKAILCLRATGQADIYLDGQQIQISHEESETGLPGILRTAQKSAALRLPAGEHTLLIRCSSPEQKKAGWSLSCWFVTPDGAPMTDLTFDTTPQSDG
jgi:hypothetical protein